MRRALMTATRTDYCDPTLLKSSDSSRWTVKNALEEHGFTVDHRACRPGEDLDDYDLIIVDANDPRGSKTQNHLGALWALCQDWNGGPPVILNWDHWDIKRIHHGLLNETAPTEVPSGPRTHASDARQYQEILEHQMDMWSEGDWQTGICCAFPWGDHERIVAKTNLPALVLFDPSNDQPLEPNIAMRSRRRVWVCAALTNHSKWVEEQKLTWPVEYYGAASDKRLERDDLLAVYGDSWGVLSPKYYHSGSGYWRARIVHSAHMGCVLGCDNSEIPYWGYQDDLRAYEQMGDSDLEHVAELQCSWLEKNTAPRDQTIEFLGGNFLAWSKRERTGEPLPKSGQDTLL